MQLKKRLSRWKIMQGCEVGRGLCSCIAAVKLLSSVHKHRIVCTIPHQVGVADVVFDQTTTTNDHASLFGIHGHVIKFLKHTE